MSYCNAYCYQIANEVLFERSILRSKLIVRTIVPQTTTILFVITIYPIDLTQVEVMMVLNQR